MGIYYADNKFGKEVYMDNYTIIIRIALAVLIGGLIGYEREIRNRPAGFRTHMLVCLGAAVVTMVQVKLVASSVEFLLQNPKLTESIKVDSGRIVAQIVSGIGFLGAGTIIVHKGTVKGLTTASTVWVVACIGIAIGYGYYVIAIIAGLATFLINILLLRIERRIAESRYSISVLIKYQVGIGNQNIEDIVGYFESKKIRIGDMKFVSTEEESIQTVTFNLFSMRMRTWGSLLEELNNKDFILEVKVF